MKIFTSAILIMGLSGLIAQILLLREMLIVFYGNELTIGIIIANWLLLEAIGSFFVGKRIEFSRKKMELFVLLQLIFSLSLPTEIYFTRILKEIVGFFPAESMGLFHTVIYSFLILLPVSISHGALFTFSCKIYSFLSKGKEAESIGKVYIYETVGTLIGGIILTYLLIPYFSSLKICSAISLLNIFICLPLLNIEEVRIKKTLFTKSMYFLSIIFLIPFFLINFSKIGDKLHISSIKKQWKGQKVVFYKNSIYGNVTVIKRENQYTFFSNGIPIITAPVPDIVFIQEFVHFPLLIHKNPEDILVISGGAGGVINEILKYPSVKRIDYAELDPLILKSVKKFKTSLTERELESKKVKVNYVDGRLFLKETDRKYDVILIGISNPQDLQANRLFTEEFFILSRKKLKKNGIIVVHLPGNLSYMGKELKDLNSCILTTLKKVFPHVFIIPGDGINFFLGSESPLSYVTCEYLYRNIKKRNINVELFTIDYLKYRLHPRWRKWFLNTIKDSTRKINRDFQPVGVFYSLSYWNALFSPHLQRFFRYFEKINLSSFLIISLFFTFLFSLISLRIKSPEKVSIPLCILTTGFGGMLFDLLLIFGFQVVYGYVFSWIGLLITFFMTGTAIGAKIIISFLNRIKNSFFLLIKIELLIIIFCIFLSLSFFAFHQFLYYQKFLPEVLFLLLSLFSGMVVGIQFPLANKAYLEKKPFLAETAGLLYGSDLLGGWIGGIIGGVLLLPILGIINTLFVIIMFKAGSFIILLISRFKLSRG